MHFLIKIHTCYGRLQIVFLIHVCQKAATYVDFLSRFCRFPFRLLYAVAFVFKSVSICETCLKNNFNKIYDILLLHKEKCSYSLNGIWKKRSMSDLSDYFGNVFQGLFDGILGQIPLESCQVGYHIHYLTNKKRMINYCIVILRDHKPSTFNIEMHSIPRSITN